MSWSKLNWDLSFTEKVKIHKLFPKINRCYPIKLEWEEYYPEGKQAFFLWQPPHSDLNGWLDGRPSEILKSHILEGELINYSFYNREFDFCLKKITPMTVFFNEVTEIDKSPLPLRLWQESRYLSKAQISSYLYLFGAVSETQLQAILSLKDKKLYLHYSDYLPPRTSESLITKYCLNEKEQKIFQTLFSKAKEIYEPELENISEDEVRGAEYY